MLLHVLVTYSLIMKFRLPLLLRTAVLACCAAVAPLASTLAAGCLFSAAAVAFSVSMVSAAELTKDVVLDNASNTQKTVAEVNAADTDTTYGLITVGGDTIELKESRTLTVNSTTKEDSSGTKDLEKWSGLYSQHNGGGSKIFVFETACLTGDGNFALVFRNGGNVYSSPQTTLGTGDNSSGFITKDGTEKFTGRILLMDHWNNSVLANYGGDVLSKAEIVFAKDTEKYNVGGTDYTCGTNRNSYGLKLTSDATLSGISGQQNANSSTETNRPSQTPCITADANGTTLTLTGECTTNKTYSFAGNVGTSDKRINLAVTGGSQLFSGTNYLNNVTVGGNGNLTLSGTSNVAGAVSVQSGGTLNLSGKLVLPENFTGIANEGSLLMNTGMTLDVSALLSNVVVSKGITGTITLVTGTGTVNSDSITDWNSIITSGKIGLTWTYSNGVLTYNANMNDLVYRSETLTWTNGVGGFDDDKTFISGDNVKFTSTTDVTLGENIAASTVTIDQDAAITLTGNSHKLTAGTIVLLGGLTLKDVALANETQYDANATSGTLKIDIGGEAKLPYNDLTSISGFAGTLEIASGRIDITKNTSFMANKINVTGGQLYVEGNKVSLSNEITFSGKKFGWTGDNATELQSAALRLGQKATLTGTVTAGKSENDIVSICCWDNNTGIITGELAGQGTLKLTGKKDKGGTLEIQGNITHNGDMVVECGTLQIGNSYTSGNTVSFERITVNSGANLYFHHNTTSKEDSLYNTKIVLNGGMMGNMLNNNFFKTIVLKDVEITAAGSWMQVNNTNTLEIENLMLENGLTCYTRGTGKYVIENLKADIADNVNATLIVQDGESKDSKTLTATNFSKTGKGSWALATGAGLTITGQLEMNYEGTLDFSAGKLTLNDGITLNYTVADGVIAGAGAGISLLDAEGDIDTGITAGNLIGITSDNLATGEDKVMISISAALRRTADKINLGILKTGDQAVDANRITLSDTLQLAGWKLNENDTEATHWVLVKGTAEELTWDTAWEIPLIKQPTDVKLADLEVPEGSTYEAPYYSDSDSVFFSVAASTDPSYTGTYSDGRTYTAINLQGSGASNLIVCGGKVVADKTGAGETVTSDTWINAAAGKYKALVGGNYANNWEGSGAMNLKGDTHIQVTGATVGTIIGGNYKDGQNAGHAGNSYITVADGGNVTGAIIGAGLVEHNAKPSMEGNTNIFIYTPLSENKNSLYEESPQMVVGGFAWGKNILMNTTLTGNTNITVDLKKAKESEVSFNKHVIGGNACLGLKDENSASGKDDQQKIVGDTNLILDLGTFSMGDTGYLIVGGSWVRNGTNIITGTASTTVNNGSSFNHVIGGSYVYARMVDDISCVDTVSVGNTELILKGGSFKNVVGASVAQNGDGDGVVTSGTLKIGTTDEDGNFTAGTSKVTISDTASVTWTTIGGFWLDGSDGEITAELGNIEVNINGGTVKDISGGTSSARDEGSVKQGNITVNLTGGTVNGSVYTAGEQRGTAGITTESTTVNIGTDVRIENTQVFGGYWVGRSENDDSVLYASQVTGDRTLNFTDEGEYMNITDQNGFYDFDVVNVEKETGKVTLNNGIQKKRDKKANEKIGDTLSFEKTGEGTLVLNNSKQNEVTVSKGTLSTGSGNNTVTSVKVANGATLSLGSGGTNKLTSVIVNTGGTLDAIEGGTSVGGSLTLGSGSMLALDEAALNLEGDLTINKGLMLSTTKDLRGVSKVNMLLAAGISRCTLGGDGTDPLADGKQKLASDTITSFTANGTDFGLDTLVLYYSNGELRLMTDLSLLGNYCSGILGEDGNAGVGATMADEMLSAHPMTGTPLANVLEGIDALIDANDLSAARKLAAAMAGSTVTALGHAQKNALRDQMGTIRDRMGTLGVNDLVVNEDVPNFHLWAQGNGGYAKLDSKGDQAGYTLNTCGGTVGADADFTENVSAGIAFTAAWGDLDAQAADTATGDLDGYYLNLYAQVKGSRQTHKIVMTGASFDATLNRTVNYGTGSYRAEGSTSGSGFGVMYEGAYDFYLNEDRDAVFRPWINLSVAHSQTDAYTETGEAENAALRIGKQKMTTSTVAVGVSFAGALSENLLGRPVWGEFRAGVSQDAGDDHSTADVGFASVPGYSGTLKGAKEGRTALQLGAGLNLPVGEQSNIYFNVNAAFRSQATSATGSVGYRYDF